MSTNARARVSVLEQVFAGLGPDLLLLTAIGIAGIAVAALERETAPGRGRHSAVWWRRRESNYIDLPGYMCLHMVQPGPYHHSYHFCRLTNRSKGPNLSLVQYRGGGCVKASMKSCAAVLSSAMIRST